MTQHAQEPKKLLFDSTPSVVSGPTVVPLEFLRPPPGYPFADSVLSTGTFTTPYGEEQIILGNQRFRKEDLVKIFGSIIEKPHRKIGNPAPLGLSTFALSTFILSLINTGACGVHIPQVVIGMGIWCGGLLQIIAGVWDMFEGNTFGAVAFSAYGSFWMAYATIITDFFGIEKAYEEHPEQFANAMGFFLLSWTLFSAMMTLCTMKSTICFMMLFVVLTCNFTLLTISEFTGVKACKSVAGVLGLVDSIIAWYIAYCAIATQDNSYITFTPTPLPGNKEHV